MQNRWTVLALLFTVRLAMAFQFQAAGAVSPAFMNTYGVALADIGLLISIYLAPGILFAVPGGEIGRRFGDKSVVLFGLALMIAGGLVMAGAEAWSLPSPESAAVVAVAGIALSGGTYLGIAAFRNVEIAAIAPFRYTTLLWSAIGAFLLLGEVPGLLSIAGAGLIVGSGIYSIHREVDAARRRAGRAAPVTP